MTKGTRKPWGEVLDDCAEWLMWICLLGTIAFAVEYMVSFFMARGSG